MKNLIILALVTLVGFLAWKVFMNPVRVVIKQSPAMNKAAEDLVNLEVEDINKKVDRNGIEHALMMEKKQLIHNYNELDSTSRNTIDSLNDALGIKDKQLIAMTSIYAEVKDSLLKATNYGDSVYTYNDRFANIVFNRPDNLFSFSYDAKVNIAEYWKRKWFMAPKRNYLEIWIPDRRATINGVERLKVAPTPDRFDLTLNGSAQYHLDEFGIGGKIKIRLGRVTGSGSYLYYPNLQQWRKSFSVDYEVGGF